MVTRKEAEALRFGFLFMSLPDVRLRARGMTALAGDFHFLGARIAAPIATVFLARRHGALAGLMGAGFLFLFCHPDLLWLRRQT